MAESAIALPAGRPVSTVVAKPVAAPAATEREASLKMKLDKVSVLYNTFTAVADVDLPIYTHRITAVIGPSGCGKSTLLRSLYTMPTRRRMSTTSTCGA